MIKWILKKIVGSKNQREVRRMAPIIEKINQYEKEYQGRSEEFLREKTAEWKKRISAIEDHEQQQEALKEVLPEAFAAVKNAARRLCGRTWNVCDQPLTWNMVHFDVQLIGGMVLHSGKIAEMATGEGKTLVATLPLYLNALTGRGVHLVTVNDYLARRDAEWMGELFRLLGLTVGCIQHDQDPQFRREQYAADITYGTNSEFGFDYLRDNGMANRKEHQVQRGYYFAIVDEVDSILIDEARVPLIIAGPATVSTHQYDRFKPLVEQLVKKQTQLCNKHISDAKELLEKGQAEEAGRLMFKVKLGQPRNRLLLRMLEDPEQRRLIEKSELFFYQDGRKDDLISLKGELYFTIDERQHEADLSELGREYLNPDDPEAFVLPDLISFFSEIDGNPDLTNEEKIKRKTERQAACDKQAERIHNISQLLRAYCLFEKDVEYIVEENKVVIIDENTGRKMSGRRWSDGLHQAVEAKEGVQIEKETQTLATITIQNYFRLYQKLAGMTGTAETDAAEFYDIYKVDVVVIPTNRPNVRKDTNDKIYKTRREKYNAAIDVIKEAHNRKQPVLVGTRSVEDSELVSRMLKREKIVHNVLNARYHRQEAEIVARAGQAGTVTISTNMAGRGTDIKLGPGVEELGGLLVVGCDRHESRRVDRQLRGRCARQGDSGASCFFVSFEDDLMRNFANPEKLTAIMERFGMKDGEELEHPWLNASVENAQKRVEQRNYMIRKRTLEFDNVMNQQREVVYGYRNEVLESEETRKLIFEVIDEAIPKKAEDFLAEDENGQSDIDSLLHWINVTFPLGLTREKAKFETRTPEENGKHLAEVVKDAYIQKTSHEDAEGVKELERYIILNAIDRLWQEHLYAMDALREGVHLRQYGQKDPLIEYKKEGFTMFEELMANIKQEVLHNLFRGTTNLQAFEQFLASLPQNLLGADSPEAGGQPQPPPQKRPVDDDENLPSLTLDMPKPQQPPPGGDKGKPGRNDPCLCGSGKKYKNCCGRTA